MLYKRHFGSQSFYYTWNKSFSRKKVKWVKLVYEKKEKFGQMNKKKENSTKANGNWQREKWEEKNKTRSSTEKADQFKRKKIYTYCIFRVERKVEMKIIFGIFTKLMWCLFFFLYLIFILLLLKCSAFVFAWTQ